MSLKILFRLFFFLLGGALLAGCGTTQYLEEDEAFLRKNRIEFESSLKIKKKQNLKQDLSTLYKQRPNERFFWVPKEWYYYNLQDTIGQRKFAKKIKSWSYRQFGEEPRKLDPAATEATERTMEYYLQNKGYFQSEVTSFQDYLDRNRKKVAVTYVIYPRQQYLIDTVQYLSRDTAILRHLQTIRGESLLKRGSPVDAKSYEQEVKRITNHLQNIGYAYFQTYHITNLEGDSSQHKVRLKMEILPPSNDSVHQVYRIGQVYLYPQYDPSSTLESEIDTMGNGIFIVAVNGEYGVKVKALLDALYLQKGAIYQDRNLNKTKKQLNALGIFQFVTIRKEPNPDNPEELIFRIFLSPNKRFEFGMDGEINTSNSPVIARRLLGLSGGVSLRHRNLFNGAELLITNTQLGVDFNISGNGQLVNTLDFLAKSELYFPKYIDYLTLAKFLRWARVIKPSQYESLEENASTRIGISYNNLRSLDFYTINSFDATLGFDYRPNNRNRFLVDHLGIDYFSPKTTVFFDTTILIRNVFLQRSFDKQLFTGFLLRNFSYNFNSLENRFGQSYSIGTNFELSGLEILVANSLYNSTRENKEGFALRFPQDTVAFSQFVLGDLDIRHYRRLTPRTSLALRFYTGIAVPFGFSEDVPYIKQFFVGGPQSVRGWMARELGPGGYFDYENAASQTNFFYQTGDFKLEMNAEYRFHLIELLGIRYEGAVFVDIGNIYTLQQDTARMRSQLLWTPTYDEDQIKTGDNFLKYLAVGSGLGLRVDFSFFIFRLDVGLKLRNPYPADPLSNDEVYWRDLSKFKLGDLNYNIGLGYPF